MRMLVVYNKTNYFLDGPQQRGATYDLGVEFEKWLNRTNKDKTRAIRVVFIPTARDHLLTDLQQGRGDIAAAGLAITPERQQVVSFSEPFMDDVSEILVTSAEGSVPATVEGLSGQSIYVRKSSSYYSSLEGPARLGRKANRQSTVPADENVETKHPRLMNAGIIDSTVVFRFPRELLAADLHQHRPTPARVCAGAVPGRSQSSPKRVAGLIRREEQGRHDDGQHVLGAICRTQWAKNDLRIRRKNLRTVRLFQKLRQVTSSVALLVAGFRVRSRRPPAVRSASASCR